ncbi:hypothetical protein [Melittangium boletus]|uniref:Uncharacterized protein n=1 Tax=Melittangium boletus DSM 14713 TaxID=1294270 RepID=A0A250IE42_9BACT|nr:hypothetical protein [Melittangium boletus]ATB29513.1 hypothetical protein MEBOL_002963 [Melittangium boletus DSM 14713]
MTAGRKLLGWGLVPLLLLAPCLLAQGSVWIITAPLLLLLGWMSFLARVVPQVQWRWEFIAEALAVACLLGVGSHLFLRGLWRRFHAETPEARPWPVRWSVSLLTLLVLLFLATMATVGAAHHVGWLVSTREPLVVSSWFRPGGFRERLERERLCEFALLQAREGVTMEHLSRALLRSEDTREVAERMFVASRRGPGDALGILVFPRDPTELEEIGGTRCGTGAERARLVPSREVSEFLSDMNVRPGGAP